MKYLFPAAFMSNMFAMTGLMIVLGLAGHSEAAADVGIVHGVTVALLFAFSSNARPIILNRATRIKTESILWTRLLLLVPLGVVAFVLSTNLVEVEASLAGALVLRRCVEWIAEIYVCDMELRKDAKRAVLFLLLQMVFMSAVLTWELTDLPMRLLVMFAWATSPLWIRGHLLLGRFSVRSILIEGGVQLLPHFGSTAVIGISTYVFRLMIFVLVGKSTAGDLYTAFAIGGLLGSVFAQAVGPTLVLDEAREAVLRFPSYLKGVMGMMALGGGALFLWGKTIPDQFQWAGKSGFFWTAVGLSLLGGVVMILAQRTRLRLLQHHQDKDVYGPDVLINILIVASVPYLFHLIGKGALPFLYLLSSSLGLVFYGAAKGMSSVTEKLPSWDVPVKTAIALLLLFPIFIQLSGTIFVNRSYNFDSAGSLLLLPIPISVLACYGGILLLGSFEKAHLALTVIFLTFVLVFASSATFSFDRRTHEQAKLILMIQYVLPMFGLVLGQQFFSKDDAKTLIAKTGLSVLTVLVPVQLGFTWLYGFVILSPYLFLFSVYQHLQYVPMIFTAIYIFALFALWDVQRYRVALVLLGALMGIYIAASLSILCVGALLLGVLGFAAYKMIYGSNSIKLLVLPALVIGCLVSYIPIMTSSRAFDEKLAAVSVDSLDVTVPRNVAERIDYWKFYAREVLEDPVTLAFGHATPPDRRQYPSAHNYYLDFAYNFGVIALLPLLGLIVFTLITAFKNWKVVAAAPSLLGLASIVIYIVLVDNSFKVGMRQPYSGILTFFLWGGLLSEMSRISTSNGSPISE